MSDPSMQEEDSPEVIDLTGSTESESEEEDDENEEEEESAQGSSEDEGEVVVNETTRARLHEAIGKLGHDRMRRVLTDLVDSMPEVEETLIRQLLTLKRKTQDIVCRWEKCSNCNDEFDVVAHRENDECSFHPGELEVNEEAFADWDEDCHGPMDDDHTRSEYPENFQWTCCDQDGRSSGCVQDIHQVVSRKRQRMTAI